MSDPNLTPQDVLALPMRENEAQAATVGEYLTELLFTLWQEQDRFSGKRPFGSSSWQYDLYKALGEAGLVFYVEDEDGYCVEVDSDTADQLIEQAIRALTPASPIANTEVPL